MAESRVDSEISFKRRAIGLVVGILLNFSVGLNDCFWAPFLPEMHEERGISGTITGIIIAGMGVGEIIVSLCLLFLLPSKRKQKLLFCLGPVITGSSTVLFGQLNSIFPEKCNSLYAISTTSSRVIQGLGTAMTFCSGAPLILTFFPDIVGKVISCFSMASPIGQIISPPIGSLLFSFGGYYLPYWVIGLTQVILSIIGFIAIPESIYVHKENEQNDENKINSAIYKFYLKNYGFILICIAAVFVFPAQYFFAGTFSLQLLEKFDIQSSESGLYAFPIILGRILFSPLFGILVDKGYSTALFSIIGCFFTAVAYFVLFITDLTEFLDNLFTFEASFFVIGFTSSAAIVSFIPINRLIFASDKNNENFDVASSDSIAAAAVYICFGLGQISSMGVFGGVVNDKLGFEWACFLQAICCVIMGLFVNIHFLRHVKNSETEVLLLK